MNLNIDNLSFSYGEEKDILNNLNLKIDREGIYVIEGINGSGKTTLLKILASIIDVESKKVMFNGISVENKMYKRMMGYIPDTPILYDELTGFEHTNVFMDLWDMKAKERNEYLDNFMDMAKRLSLDVFLEQKVRELSYGTKYKLFFSLMISRNPKLLLLDEPFASLDIRSQDIAIDYIKEYGKKSIIIVSSHQKDVINKLLAHRYELIDGCLEEKRDEKNLENIYNS